MSEKRSYAGVPLSMAHLCELDTPPARLIEIVAAAGFAMVGLRVNPAAAGGISYPQHQAEEQAEGHCRVAAPSIDVPLPPHLPQLDAGERLKRLVEATRTFLAKRRSP